MKRDRNRRSNRVKIEVGRVGLKFQLGFHSVSFMQIGSSFQVIFAVITHWYSYRVGTRPFRIYVKDIGIQHFFIDCRIVDF